MDNLWIASDIEKDVNWDMSGRNSDSISDKTDESNPPTCFLIKHKIIWYLNRFIFTASLQIAIKYY